MVAGGFLAVVSAGLDGIYESHSRFHYCSKNMTLVLITWYICILLESQRCSDMIRR